MKSKNIPTKTQGPISSELLNLLMQQGTVVFNIGKAAALLGKNRIETAKFLSSLSKRGLLIRIKAGLYLIPQPGQEAIQLGNWPIIAKALAQTTPYYLSHYSAMRLHGMTAHLSLDVFITVSKRMTTRKLLNMTYRFINIKKDFFWGYQTIWITKQDKVSVSTLEKTILDCLERPDLCGGITEIARGIGMKRNEIDWDKLTESAKRFNTLSAVKRLGFLLENLKIGKMYLEFFEKKIMNSKDYVLLDPAQKKQGKYISRWRIQVNIAVEELFRENIE